MPVVQVPSKASETCALGPYCPCVALPRRRREVLHRLLTGEGEKQMAAALRLSVNPCPARLPALQRKRALGTDGSGLAGCDVGRERAGERRRQGPPACAAQRGRARRTAAGARVTDFADNPKVAKAKMALSRAANVSPPSFGNSEDGWLPPTEMFTAASGNAEAVVFSRLLGTASPSEGSIGPICSSTKRFICESEVISFRFSLIRRLAVRTA
jgi:hypothetical protein